MMTMQLHGTELIDLGVKIKYMGYFASLMHPQE